MGILDRISRTLLVLPLFPAVVALAACFISDPAERSRWLQDDFVLGRSVQVHHQYLEWANSIDKDERFKNAAAAAADAEWVTRLALFAAWALMLASAGICLGGRQRAAVVLPQIFAWVVLLMAHVRAKDANPAFLQEEVSYTVAPVMLLSWLGALLGLAGVSGGDTGRLNGIVNGTVSAPIGDGQDIAAHTDGGSKKEQ